MYSSWRKQCWLRHSRCGAALTDTVSGSVASATKRLTHRTCCGVCDVQANAGQINHHTDHAASRQSGSASESSQMTGGSELGAAALQADSNAISVHELYHIIGEVRGCPTATLGPEQVLRMRQLHTQQLQQAAAAEAATVGAWQQLPHKRLTAQAAICCGPQMAADVPCVDSSQTVPPAASDIHCQHGCQDDTTGASQGQTSSTCSDPAVKTSRDLHSPVCAAAAAAVHGDNEQQASAGTQQQQQQLQKEGCARSPLMHHAALMHFAALKAAAGAAADRH